MLPFHRSQARLRTRTGCLECRKRRKKCDEQPPRCGGCSRNALDCTWPTPATQPLDGRRRSHRLLLQGSQNTSGDSIPPSFRLSDHFNLYQHFAYNIMPRLVRQNCPPEYAEQTHMLYLAQEFPPLMAVMVAIAALDLDTACHYQAAMESYLFSLRCLQDCMRDSLDGKNADGLLATTICLCVFENSRLDSPSSVAPHATMAGALLARRPLNQAPQPTIVFERICAESFLYHSTLLMLFEPSLDVLCRVNPPVNFTRYFASLESGEVKQPRISASTQPVLDASYEFFLTIADVTRLARIARPLDKTEVEMWERLQGDLLQWEGTVLNDPCRMLYLLAMHILLLKVDPRMSLCRRTERIYGLLQLGLSAIDRLDVHKSLQGYLLWPLAVLGSVTIDNNVRCIIEKKLSLLSQTRHGLVMRVKKRIEMIWDSQEGDKEIVMLRRLRMLVEGI